MDFYEVMLFDTFFQEIGLILQMILPFVVLVIFAVLLKKILNADNKKQMKNIDKTKYYRDIPCSGDINIAFWLLYNYSDLKKNDLINGMICAYLLKWYKLGYIDIIKEKGNNYTIDLKDGNWEKTIQEKRLYHFFKTVSGNNNLLEKNEIKNYCSLAENKDVLPYLVKDMLTDTKKELEEEQKIAIKLSQSYILFSTPEKIILSNDLISEYENLLGLNNFLIDYSSIKEKEHIEVKTWEEYLIFANLFCIADKVQKQFKKIYSQNVVTTNVLDVDFNGTIVGTVDRLYKVFRWQALFGVSILLLTILSVIVRIFNNGNFVTDLLKLITIIVISLFPFYFLRKHLVNKKVKEMNGKTYARIDSVKSEYYKEWDSDDKKYYTRTVYYFTYTYKIGSLICKGSGSSNSYKRNGQKIKIYYNEKYPQNNEISEEHNKYLYYFIMILGLYVVVGFLTIKIFFSN